MTRRETAAAIAYATIGVLTFGHAATVTERQARADHKACLASGADRFCPTTPMDEAGFVGAFSGALWPAYWVWTAFDVMEAR